MSKQAEEIRAFVHDIKLGEHALLEFAAPDERLAAMREFVQAGLKANERTLVVAHPDTPDTMKKMLSDLEGFEGAITKGQLLVFPGTSFHESLGKPSRAALEALHGKLVEEAKRDGFKGVRGCIDVTYYLDAGEPGSLERFEDAIGREFPFAFRLLCLLDASEPRAAAAHLHERHTAGKTLRLARK